MFGLDSYEAFFIFWAFSLETILIIRLALRMAFFVTYTLKYGWLAAALFIPGVVISLILLFQGKSCAYWMGGFLFLIYAALGTSINYRMSEFARESYSC